MRLDLYLVNENYFESRNKAQEEIKNGNIKVDGKVITKPSFELDGGTIEVINSCPYVSRGGYKLEGAIKLFKLNFDDKIVLDIGSSTGGFTDCSLQNGAKLVYSVDVGSNQLHESLRNNPRVKVYENTNIKDFNIGDKVDIIVMDVSFVSIEYLISDIDKFIDDDTLFVTLIKPQFEIGKIHIKNGIVKDKKLYLEVLNNISNELSKYNLGIEKIASSPILGGSGNKEFLALIKRNIKTNINFREFLKGEYYAKGTIC